MVLSLFVNEENETNVCYNLIVTCRKLSRDQNVDMFITNLLNLNLIVSNFNLHIWTLFSLNFFYLYYVLCCVQLVYNCKRVSLETYYRCSEKKSNVTFVEIRSINTLRANCLTKKLERYSASKRYFIIHTQSHKDVMIEINDRFIFWIIQ